MTAATAGALALAFALDPGAAHAQRISCQDLHDQVRRSGELPQFTILSRERAVVVDTSEGSCKESIEAWSARRWPTTGTPRAQPRAKTRKPRVAPETSRPTARTPAPDPEPKPEPEPKTVTRPGSILPPDPKNLPPPPPPPPPPKAVEFGAPTCEPLDKFWRAGSYTIGKISYRLVQVFTIDTNNDDTIDNLGFKLRDAKDFDRIIRYRARIGETSADGVIGLRLADETVIGRLCFGELILKVAKIETGEEKKPEPVIVIDGPDLAKEFVQRGKGEAPNAQEKSEPKGMVFWIIVGGGGGGGLIAIGVAGYLTRKKWLPGKGDGDEDDDNGGDDDDFEEDAGGGFGDEDDEDGANKKPKTGLFKGLFGSFKGKKKKRGDGDEDGDGEEEDDEDDDEDDEK